MRRAKHRQPLTGRGRALAIVAAALAIVPLRLTALEPDQSPPLANVSFDQLLIRLQRYGSTALRRKQKADARAELFRRGGASLRYLVERAYIRNMWIHVYTEKLAKELEKDEAVPVLVDLLQSERRECRKMAAYWLWEYDAPEHSAELQPLLEVEYTAAAAMRTLGKWRCEEALPRIVEYLKNENERRRIAAANALRDIADPRAIPALIEAAGDDVVTVRKCAARALVAIGEDAVTAVAEAAGKTRGKQQRELVLVLGRIGTKEAIEPIVAALDSTDRPLRRDAARALFALAPAGAPAYLETSDRQSLITPTGALRIPPAPTTSR